MKRVWPVLKDLLPLLPSGAQRYFMGYMVATTMITALDVVAMSLLAVILGPALTGAPLRLPIIGEIPITLVPALALAACILIITKSVLSLILHWFATRRFAK